MIVAVRFLLFILSKLKAHQLDYWLVSFHLLVSFFFLSNHFISILYDLESAFTINNNLKISNKLICDIIVVSFGFIFILFIYNFLKIKYYLKNSHPKSKPLSCTR